MFGFALLVVLIGVLWKWLLAGAVIWLAVHLLGQSFRRHEAAVDRERARQAALIARADQEHAWVLEGDERGIYGCGWDDVQKYRHAASA